MAYYLYLPQKAASPPAAWPMTPASSPARLPLLVMLHGCEQTATEFAQGTRMNHLAEKKGWAVLYPQQSRQNHPNRCWKWYDSATQAGGGDVGLIVGVIEKVAASQPIDRSRIYLCGISAGAAMAHIVALNHPQLIAAIGLHSAPLFGAGRSPLGAYQVMQQGDGQRMHGAIAEVLARSPHFPSMPTILIQGQGDTVVRPINQSQLEQQVLLLHRSAIDRRAPAIDKPASAANRRRGTHAYSVRDFCQKNKALLRVVKIAGLAHSWSGGDGALPFHSGVGPDASQLMLAFFARHRRLAPAAAPRHRRAIKARA